MSYAVWYDFINVILAFGLCQAVKLLVHLPLVEQMSDRHQPHFGLRPTEQGCSIKNGPVRFWPILGADVIKVEAPEGDDTRRWGPPFIEREGDRSAAYFHSTQPR
jgi:hypothetical protein